MIELFETISSYLAKFYYYFETLFENVKDSITELGQWFQFMPASLVAAATIILVLLVIFRVLGR